MELATGYTEELRVKILQSEDRTGGAFIFGSWVEVGIICAIQRGIFIYTRIVYVVFTLEIGAYGYLVEADADLKADVHFHPAHWA